MLIGYQKNQNANSIYDIIAKYRPEKDSNGIVEYSNYLVVVFNVEGNGEYINFEHEYTLKLFAYGMMCYEFGKTEIDKYITNNMIDNAYKML